MKVLINHQIVEQNSITYNDGLNYGRFPDIETELYRIELSIEQFIRKIQIDYNRIKEEIQADDIKYNDTSAFTTVQYCSLKELLNYPVELQDIFLTSLDQLLYKQLFSQSTNSMFVINSTDTIVRQKGIIIITGRCYQRR